MKSFRRIYGALILTTSMTAFAAEKYSAGSYQIDPMHSKVGFEVPHLIISTVEGKFTKVQGSIDLDKNFKNSVVQASIDANSIDTGVGQRDDHLRSADFFNVKENPNLEFKSTSISGSPEKFKLVGDLTIRGVTRKVTLDSKYFGTVVDGYGNEKVVIQGKTKINRKDFGLTWNNAVEAGPVVGDEISIDLRIQAALAKAKAPSN
jgi:polyisoprenoid-binding protein YceI